MRTIKESYWDRRVRIANYLRRLARTKGCLHCGTNKANKFDYHHPGEKNFKMSKAYERTDEDIHAELKLVVILCAGCHTRLHMIGNQHRIGSSHTQETKDILSKAQKKYMADPKARANISRIKMGNQFAKGNRSRHYA